MFRSHQVAGVLGAGGARRLAGVDPVHQAVDQAVGLDLRHVERAQQGGELAAAGPAPLPQLAGSLDHAVEVEAGGPIGQAGADHAVFYREHQDRKNVALGKSVSVRVDLGVRRIIKSKKYHTTTKERHKITS